MTQRRRARHERGRRLHGILLFDKPSGGSSNQVMQRVRRLYDANKAGHTGSLDPLATGMLPICFGEATKLSRFLLDANKGYETTMQLGVTTDSADSDGEPIEERPLPSDLSISHLQQLCDSFVGDSLQVPPMVSAIKVNGKRLYALARQGIEIEREPRKVHISEVKVLGLGGSQVRLSVRCSKGTYIRSLVTDLGEQLGCGAHVCQLRRVFVAPFEGHTMWTQEQIEASNTADEFILPMDAGLLHLPQVTIEKAALPLFLQGQAVPGEILSAKGQPVAMPEQAGESLLPAVDPTQKKADMTCRVYADDGRLIGLAVPKNEGLIAPCRVLQW